MNAWKCLSLCVVLGAISGGGCGGEESTRMPPSGGQGGGGIGGGGGGGGMTGGNAGTQVTGGTSGGASGLGGASGTGGGEGGMGGGEGGMGGGATRVFDAGSAPDRNDVTAGELCDRLATIQCAGEAYCCDSPGRDVAACHAAMKDACDDGFMFDALAEAPKTGFDAARAKAAYEHIEHLASQCDVSVAAYGVSVDGLRGMFQGTIAQGSSCTTFNLAFRQEVAKALAACSGPASTACLPISAINWQCEARAAAGGRCFTDVNCMDGLYCDNPMFEIAGSTCMPRKADGAPCGLPNECQSLTCRGGACVPATAQTAYCLAQ